MARVQPREVIATRRQLDATHTQLPSNQQPLLIPYPAYRFELTNARQTLLDQFKVSTLQGFGLEDKPFALRAAGAILAYLRETQPAALQQMNDLRVYSTAHFMGLDAVTRRNLELTERFAQAKSTTSRAVVAGHSGQDDDPDGCALDAHMGRAAVDGAERH